MIASSFYNLLFVALMVTILQISATNAAPMSSPAIVDRDIISGPINGNGCSNNYVNGKLVTSSGCSSNDQDTTSSSSSSSSSVTSPTPIYADNTTTTSSITNSNLNGAYINSPGQTYIISSVVGVLAAFAILG